jgi:sec-independent protein translocase protein TatA
MFAMLNGWEIVLILAVVLVLFGAKKLPELARGLGSGIKEFKKATRDITDELDAAVNSEPPPPPRKLPEKTVPPVMEKEVTETAGTVPHNPSEPKA